jgi:hypothetical protein
LLQQIHNSISYQGAPRLSSSWDFDRHFLSVSFARLDFLAGFLDGSEDGIIFKRIVNGYDFGGLFVKADVERLDTFIADRSQISWLQA